MKIVITGASGMLGRALHRLLLQSCSSSTGETNYAVVVGTGFSRLQVTHQSEQDIKIVHLEYLDLLDHEASQKFLSKHQPHVIVHCAAQRHPDAFENHLESSIKLNVKSTEHLAKECARLALNNKSGSRTGGPYLIYISTSYVFDGGVQSNEHPPYMPDSKTNPINNYGLSKWAGECAVNEILNRNDDIALNRGIIVRVPLLYGEDCQALSESPALEMIKAFLPRQGHLSREKKKIDDWALRFPTSCEDVATVLKAMIDQLQVEGTDRDINRLLAGTHHVSSPHGITKYNLMKLQCKLVGILLSTVDEVTEGNETGSPTNLAPRPRCTQLDCSSTWSALGWTKMQGDERGGDDGHDNAPSFQFRTLKEGMERALAGFPHRFIPE